MTVNVEKGLAFCYLCGKSYRTVDFVAQVEGITKFRAMQMVRENRKVSHGPDRLQTALESLRLVAPKACTSPTVEIALPPTKAIEESPEAIAYLTERRFGPEVWHAFGLRYCAFPGPYNRRIVIPVRLNGELIGFQARAILPGVKPKYLFPTEGGFQNTLYNWDRAKRYETVIIVEGVTDLWRLWVAGIPNVACSFGKTLKEEQRRLLLTAANVKRVAFFWDGEAVESTYKAAERLKDFKEVRAVELPDGIEPDTCPDPHAYIRAAIDPTTLTALERQLRAKRMTASRR
jgi:DNA primase